MIGSTVYRIFSLIVMLKTFFKVKLIFRFLTQFCTRYKKNTFFSTFWNHFEMHLVSTNSFSGNVGLKITQIKYMFCGYSKENDYTQCVLNTSNQLCNSLELQKLGAKGYNWCLKCLGNPFFIPTLESGINVALQLLIFWLFSRGYGLIPDFIV